MSYIKNLSNALLLSLAAAARTAAHQAPLGEVTDVNKNGAPTGDRFITNHTSGWAARSREWAELSDECESRGLPLPPCNCPEGSHR